MMEKNTIKVIAVVLICVMLISVVSVVTQNKINKGTPDTSDNGGTQDIGETDETKDKKEGVVTMEGNIVDSVSKGGDLFLDMIDNSHENREDSVKVLKVLKDFGILDEALSVKKGEINRQDFERVLVNSIGDDYIYPFEGTTYNEVMYEILTELNYVPIDGYLGEGSDGDFKLENAHFLAKKLGLVSSERTGEDNITHEDLYEAIYNMLHSNIVYKGSNTGYMLKLVENKADCLRNLFRRHISVETREKIRVGEVDAETTKLIKSIVEKSVEYHGFRINGEFIEVKFKDIRGFRYYDNNIVEVGLDIEIYDGVRKFESFSEVYLVLEDEAIVVEDIRSLGNTLAVGAVYAGKGETREYTQNNGDIRVSIIKNDAVVREYTIPYIDYKNVIDITKVK